MLHHFTVVIIITIVGVLEVDKLFNKNFKIIKDL